MTDHNPNNPRGGARPGAGRPPKYDEAMVGMRVRVPRHYKRVTRSIGDGNLSLGVRRIVEFYCEENGIDTEQFANTETNG